VPHPAYAEAVETTKIHSITGILGPGRALVMKRPFRAPHHNISDAGLIGGGTVPRPDEVNLAYNGVLFLDEFPEFQHHADLQVPLAYLGAPSRQIEIHIEVPKWISGTSQETDRKIHANAQMSTRDIGKYCTHDAPAERVLVAAI